MGLKSKSSDLRRRSRYARRGGGEKAIEKQKAIGKMTAMERIISLLDPKTFHEYDLFVEHAGKDFDMDKKYLPGDGVVTGYGTIEGRTVYVHRTSQWPEDHWDGCMPRRLLRSWIMLLNLKFL